MEHLPRRAGRGDIKSGYCLYFIPSPNPFMLAFRVLPEGEGVNRPMGRDPALTGGVFTIITGIVMKGVSGMKMTIKVMVATALLLWTLPAGGPVNRVAVR